MAATPDLITDLETIKRLATARRDEFEVMRYMLELNDDLSDAEIDRMVEDVAQPVIAAIDCTTCANCCRSLDVYLTPEDAERLASGIHVPVEALLDAVIDREAAEAEGEWGRFRAKPCAFLRGKLCSVYAYRPESCRTYPVFTPDFRWTLEDTIEGAAICPIIYNVLDRLVPLVDRL
ncbi:MAG: YkgJ family cysteine cluster protein [Chloroflexota bacterium]